MKIDKKNGKGFSSFLGALVAFIFIIIAFNTIITSFFKKDIKTETPVEEVFYNSVAMNSALIKTEEVYQAGRHSYFTTQAKEGEKVKRGLENLSVTKSANDLIDKKIDAINKRLKDLDYDTSGEESIDQKAMNRKIKALQISINQKRYEDLSQILNSSEDEEDKYYESIKNYSIDKLLEMKDELNESKRSEAPAVKVSMSGIVSYFIDGLEDKYTNENFDALFEKDLIEDSKSYSLNQGKSNDNFKILDNFSMNILAFSDDKKLEDVNVNDVVLIEWDLTGTKTYARILKKEKTGDTYKFLLNIRERISELYKDRFSKMEIIFDEYKTFKLPKSALVDRGSEKGVYIKDIDNTIRYKRVLLVGSDRDNIYVMRTDDNGLMKYKKLKFKSIKYYDEVVVFPSTVKEGDIL
ncbi:MAG: HlyD family efflux transporter periplasmic adaptor subunit [Eubacteriales bacterium]|uniref:HlyD family efflux transporter periplasmic adaptor subunit n=1 Tax=Fenollaria sp. TaxID=1965292 RepID=UPI002A748CC8|nr:HlyD family efflux transporter periplasmic adaptor subunit [Fenollaria sp.]MDD7338986.1 HlyD family efflux transporter periplasmic adaptor subunit [Eubacteriales bacterium]MDY3106535.1 HlyD family efflux transporter periplasmic adaptor subunit [Fenollaria sp.]